MMEFSNSSDEEPTVAYDEYCFTPLTDSFVVKPLWKEHFKRPAKYRNPEIKRAFQVQCSIYQFMYPDLSSTSVTKEVTKILKTKSKPSKTFPKLVFKGIDESEIVKSNEFHNKAKHDENKEMKELKE